MHPVMQSALAGFMPPPKSYDAVVMASKPAKRPKPTQSFHYCLNGVDLECELDYEAASGDGWNEPHEQADAILCEAFCGDTDIVEILSDDQKRDIEIAFLEQEPEGY